MTKEIKFGQAGFVPTIKFSGIFDMQNFMKTLRSWIVNQGFEFHEKGLKYKVPSPAGAEQEFAWWGWRKVNDYVKYHIDIFFHFWEVHDVEVVKDGKKQKLQSAKVQIEMTARYELDWSNRFGGSRFLQALADFYDKYIVRKDIETVYEDKLYYRLYRLHQLAKEYLEFETKSNAYEDMW